MSDFPVLSRLLSANAQWAEDVDRAEPTFFAQSAKGQSPKILWFGCSDSRVPESVVTASKPGDIFVQRNVANQFHLNDDNALSVLSYSVDHVGVEHVLVVGHSNCGGATACLAASQKYDVSVSDTITDPTAPADAPINRWLAPLTTLAASLRLSTAPQAEGLAVLVDENVKAQVANIAQTDVIIAAWANGKQVWIHGWVYDLASGKLRDLGVSVGPPSK